MGLVDKNFKCATMQSSENRCIFYIRPPKDGHPHFDCELREKEFEYTLNGHKWMRFTSDPKVFSLSSIYPNSNQKKFEVL